MLQTIRDELHQYAVPAEERKVTFFKTGKGEYAEHDEFLGVSTPHLRKIAKANSTLPLLQIGMLLKSPINDERLLALMMLVERYQKGDAQTKEDIFNLYHAHLKHVNNWNLVDASAHHIMGAHLHQQNKECLFILASSSMLWERRIAIVATWYFIRQNEFTWTIKLAEQLLHDREDLIQKAVGWMLREMGKRNETELVLFLEKHVGNMPRTMLRYAIEKLNHDQKKMYMSQKLQESCN